MDFSVALKTTSGLKFVSYNDIIYCKADGRYTDVFLKSGKTILTARLLKDFEKRLPHDLFVRIHKSYLINIKYISYYNKSSSNLTMDFKTDLEVSRRRKRMLYNKLESSFIVV